MAADAAASPPASSIAADGGSNKRKLLWGAALKDPEPPAFDSSNGNGNGTVTTTVIQDAAGGSAETLLTKCARSKLCVGLGVAVVSAIILFALNPPIVQQKPKDDVSLPSRSYQRIAILSGVAGVLAAALPVCVGIFAARRAAAA
jgi:hypothetical protein